MALLALPPAPPLDTHWFAVDELGSVAMFCAGELGPVPEPASSRWPPGSLLETELLPRLADADPRALSYAAADLFGRRSGLLGGLLGGSVLESPPRFEQSLADVLVQLRPAAGLDERLASAGLHRLPSRDGEFAWAGVLASPVLRELWREGWVVRAALAHRLEPTRMGMFCYEHAGRRDADYARRGEPITPLRVQALPISLRSRLTAVRFADVDFRELESIDANRARGPR